MAAQGLTTIEAATSRKIRWNARGRTPLVQSIQTIGIDQPLKALVWRDASGTTWLSYNDPAWPAERHGLGGDAAAAVGMMTTALDAVASDATAK